MKRELCLLLRTRSVQRGGKLQTGSKSRLQAHWGYTSEEFVIIDAINPLAPDHAPSLG